MLQLWVSVVKLTAAHISGRYQKLLITGCLGGAGSVAHVAGARSISMSPSPGAIESENPAASMLFAISPTLWIPFRSTWEVGSVSTST